MIKIDYKEVIKTDISFLEKYYHKVGHIESAFSEEIPQAEHYKLLTYLSFQFNNCTILDLGTFDGLSAICLAQNPTNKVITYDIVDKDLNDILHPVYIDGQSMKTLQHTPYGKDYPNISFKKMDVINEDEEILKSSPFLFLDISHNGKDERAFTDKLFSIGYKGYVLCDDVETNLFPLREWFSSLQTTKYYLTPIGHSTGTGLLDMGDNGVEVLK